MGYGNISEELIKYDLTSDFIYLSKNDLNCYCSPKGNNELISLVVNFFKKMYGKNVKENQVLITNGTTNSIALINTYLKERSKCKIVVQNPTYDTAINIIKSHNLSIQYINPIMDNIRDCTADAFYLMFRCHNPTGMNIASEKEFKIKEKILSNESILIEDDAYSLLFKSNKAYLPVKNENYLFLGSFSKYIFPAIRIGYVIGSPKIIEQLSIFQKYYNSHPNQISQLLLITYLKTGKIFNEIEHKKKILNKRKIAFEQSLSNKAISKIKNLSLLSGFYYWLEFNENINANTIFKDLYDEKVFVIPGEIYSLNYKQNSLRICISNIEEEKIRKATKIINKVIDRI